MQARLTRLLLLLAGLFALGTIGYSVIEKAPVWDAFYMTVITLTTVGYREVFPLSRTGQGFTVLLLVSGIGFILWIATEIGRTILEGELRDALGQARRSRMIGSLENHEIVCGWGRMGQAVVSELIQAKRNVVVVECKGEKIQKLQELNIPFVTGDATSEAILRSAGVDRARGLVACLNDDAHNVYTVLTARSINPKLFIVARAGEEGAEARMKRAGADRVVNPYQHGGVRLAHLVLKPSVVDFLDFSLATGDDVGLELEQMRLSDKLQFVGKTLAQADLRRKCGIGVVAVRRGDKLFPNPEAELQLEAGDVLIVLGTREQLARFEALVCSVEEETEV